MAKKENCEQLQEEKPLEEMFAELDLLAEKLENISFTERYLYFFCSMDASVLSCTLLIIFSALKLFITSYPAKISLIFTLYADIACI